MAPTGEQKDANTARARIRIARDSLKMSQAEFAKALGMSVRGYQAYETRGRLPSGKTLARALDIGISVDWLLTGQGEMRRVVVGPSEAGNGVPIVKGDVPGYNLVVDAEGATHERVDLVPEVLAPVLQWVAEYTAGFPKPILWEREAGTLIARYTWDFYTWLNARRTEKAPASQSSPESAPKSPAKGKKAP
jgi:transcriptional regulator with XRE-family HTH domain